MSPVTPENTLPDPASITPSFSTDMAVDIDISDGTGEPVYQRCRFITDLSPDSDPVQMDAATYEDRGSPNMKKSGESWTLSFKIQAWHKKEDGSYLPELDKLLEASAPDSPGEVAVRWYDWPDPARRQPNVKLAYAGVGTVKLTRATTGKDGEFNMWQVEITGQGARAKIKHPDAPEADPEPGPGVGA